MRSDWGAVIRVVLRSLFVQGSWNYRTLLGAGVAWGLLPFRPREERAGTEERWVARMGESFNAHPFLSSFALGALVRIEGEGEDPERIRLFREALRSPLGSLGDAFFWSAWRPFCLIVAFLTALTAVPPLLVVAVFLLLWNVVHLFVRLRGAASGIALGFQVAGGIRAMAFPRWTERIATLGVLLLGLLCGVLLQRAPSPSGSGWVWTAAVVLCLAGGVIGGGAVSRWAPGLLLVLAVLAAWLPGV